ncbi:4-(cytidine 5'-diphospho)-2-C-methyl-D-erythritol kinase [Roseicella aquatilis]|uniref:4-diphosphocytidyl-2-C-methyl-D-erythritol kinase n=1 Tax=Roseicella aquatilis TaxID=2527868 RepID=A0A4R4DKH0_9PROT|nr:4-(cytidine 5'-diphospho)-2-C-methyl-D-erythritol kinase [Roseicella aquatilis]TCZ61300.1 4-(cytidine 5'-diphospho)-2-C-methyl-D-erythritol kinase [Roseicella aquatilis]
MPAGGLLAEAAPAKVNLYLHVTGRRADGYHLLDSLAVFGPAADALSLAPAEGLTLALDGPFGGALARDRPGGEHGAHDVPAGEGPDRDPADALQTDRGLEAEPDNLVLRAARALAEAAGVPPRAALRLTKRLPVASGIGGGSADAAAALRGLDRLWGLNLGEARLAAVAAPLGADIPVCVASRPARMGGVGELLSPAPRLPRCGLLLANPGLALPTPAVFRARSGGFTPPARLPESWPDAAAMARDLGAATRNDLEPAAIALCPAVAEVLAAIRALPGCLLARMSGSGATCFGLFADAAAAGAAAALLPGGWWRAAGGLYERGG